MAPGLSEVGLHMAFAAGGSRSIDNTEQIEKKGLK